MDQAHGGSVGGWDPNSFGGEQWDHQFGGSHLPFGQSAAAESSYPNPDFLDGGDINPQLSEADSHSGMYRPFDYYSQVDVWSDHPQPSAVPFAQPSSTLPQGYFGGQRHPIDANPTVESRFALDIQRGNEFSSQIQSAANPQQANSHHGFGHGVTNANGYAQGSVPQQWQEQVPAGYASGHQYENPLAAAPVSNGSASSFYPGHGASASTMPGYQPEVHQQVPANVRTAHSQFVPALNGQPQQPVPVAASPRKASAQPPARTATPQQAQQIHQQLPKQLSHQAIPQHQPAQQPIQQPVQQPVQQQIQQPIQPPAQRPAVQPVPQSNAGQHLFAQQSVSQSHTAEADTAVGVKRGFASETQAAPAAAKKARVVVPEAANTPPPPIPAPVQAQPLNLPDPAPINTINYRDTSRLSSAQGHPELKWPGVPNLVLGSAPVKLQKGTPTKRYVTLSTKGGKDPLFSKAWRAWTPAESLGNHADAYQKATSDLERQQADIRLDIETKRGRSGECRACEMD